MTAVMPYGLRFCVYVIVAGALALIVAHVLSPLGIIVNLAFGSNSALRGDRHW
jgi:hypothetical protein